MPFGGIYFIGEGQRPDSRLNTVSVQKGGNMIDYSDADAAVRSIFEEELRKNGIKMRMPLKGQGGPK